MSKGVQFDPASIYLRLDVDYSLEWARRVAQINAEEEVCGTFFILLNSNIYNPLSFGERKRIFDILNCGQEIGLHVAWPPAWAGDDIGKYVADIYEIFQRCVSSSISPVVAWHNPPRELVGGDECIPGTRLVNVYS